MSENRENRENSILTRWEEVYGEGNVFGLSNKAWISGRIEKDPEFSHQTLYQIFVKISVLVKRQSGVEDRVVVIMPKNFIPSDKSLLGKYIEAGGRLRSRFDESKHLCMFLVAKDVNIADKVETETANAVYIEGYICKKPVFRQTPMGRDITDLFIAVNHDKNSGSDYLPCIAWGRNAIVASEFKVGQKLKIWARIQSRCFEVDEGFREINELSITNLMVTEE